MLYEPVSRAKQASKKSAVWHQWKLLVQCIYLIYSVMYQAYMFKHNVDSARKYAYPLWLSDYTAYLNVLHIYLFWTSIYTHLRKCVCLDTRLHDIMSSSLFINKNEAVCLSCCNKKSVKWYLNFVDQER